MAIDVSREVSCADDATTQLTVTGQSSVYKRGVEYFWLQRGVRVLARGARSDAVVQRGGCRYLSRRGDETVLAASPFYSRWTA